MRMKIAGVTIPCWDCLDIGRKRSAKYCYAPGMYLCKKCWANLGNPMEYNGVDECYPPTKEELEQTEKMVEFLMGCI